MPPPINLDSLSLVSPSPCSILKHSLVNLLHQVVHKFIDIFIKLSRCLKVHHLMLFREPLGLFSIDLPFLFQVDLVAHQHLHDGRVRVLVNALQPGLHVRKGQLVCHVECHDHAVRLLVERIRYCLEPFLTCCVPDFYCDVLVVRVFISCRNVV